MAREPRHVLFRNLFLFGSTGEVIMIYTVNDVAQWVVVGIIVTGFIFAFVWVRDWLSDRFGYDPLDRLKKK